MNVNLPIGRRLEMSRPAKISEFGQEEISLAFVGPAAAPCPDPSLARPNPLCIRPLLFNSHDRALVSERHGETARRANPAAKLFGGYMQFGFRSYKLKEGRERTGHVGVRAPNEHSLHFGKFGGQFVHRALAVPPSSGNYTLGQQCDPNACSHTAQNRFDRAEFQGLCGEYSSLVQQIVQPYSI